MGDGGVSIPPWSVTIAPPRLRLTKNGMFLLGHVMPKRNMLLLGHLGTVLRLDGTYIWTERSAWRRQ